MQAPTNSPGISSRSVWRQIVCLCVAWIALIVSLVAIPQIVTFTAVAFAGLLVALGVSWSLLGRSARRELPAPAPASHVAASPPR